MYCIWNMWCLCSVKYLEFHGWLWGGTMAWLTGLGGLFGHLKFPRILLLHHLLGKAVFPTGWDCLWQCVGCGIHAHTYNYYYHHIQLLFLAVLTMCRRWFSPFPELNLLILTWPSHPWSCFQTQLYHVVLFRPSSVHSVSCLWLSRNGTFPWTI